MSIRRNTRTWAAIVAIGAALAILVTVPVPIQAQQSNRPISAQDFAFGSVRGFDLDRANTWPQSMVWWHDALYVGTARQSLCSSLYAVYQFAWLTLGQTFADTYLPYPPPSDPDLACPADGTDLSLQAEIWRWTSAGGWARVFQSPADLDNPGVVGLPTCPPDQPSHDCLDTFGKKVPYEIAIRGLEPFVEPDGTESLYAFGVNSTVLWDRNSLPPPRILRTIDGFHWEPVPQTPGTFLHDLPFNPDHSSFRAPTAFNGKMFVLSGPIFGQGALIGSANPAAGDDAWFLAADPSKTFYEAAVFNGWLYLGTLDLFSGYSVFKTKADGPPPYDLIPVVPPGAFLKTNADGTVFPSRSVVSMIEDNGRLYIGTATMTEVIRINPDDTWDLVVGPPREVTYPDGSKEMKYPLSGLDAGFGHTLNDHVWEMVDGYRNLYFGTYNAATASRTVPGAFDLLKHNMGAHLYRTKDGGWYVQALTTNGFANLGDPHGGMFDFGFRTMAQTPHGAFFGAANDHYGLMTFRAQAVQNIIDPPSRVELEKNKDGVPRLSWDGPKGTYEIWRSEINPIFVRDNFNFEGWNGTNGTKLPDRYVGPYSLIGTTTKLYYTDNSVLAGHKYMYYVLLKMNGKTSDQSNLVAFPLNTPTVTYQALLRFVDVLEARGRYTDPLVKMSRVRKMIQDSQAAAQAGKIDNAIKALQTNKAVYDTLPPDSTDIEIFMSKMIRKLTLYKQLNDMLFSEIIQ